MHAWLSKFTSGSRPSSSYGGILRSLLFCRDTGLIQGRSIFFFVLFLFSSQKPGYLFKKELHIERKSANIFIFVSLKLNCLFSHWGLRLIGILAGIVT